jgi:hypothetical protein
MIKTQEIPVDDLELVSDSREMNSTKLAHMLNYRQHIRRLSREEKKKITLPIKPEKLT